MWVLYLLGIYIYHACIWVASFFNGKAKLWIDGRRQQLPVWKELKNSNTPRILFHCASLGEFEQGRPLLEALKLHYPNHKIVLTFFSPSGYEIKKNEPLADYVFYLPLDGYYSSHNFIDAINPSAAFFVKYEFWFFYGKYLHEKKIPYFCVSAIFKPNQIFFQPWGGFFRKLLLRFNHLFVQDQNSLQILYKHSIARVTVAGDTRFDRVKQLPLINYENKCLDDFCKGHHIVIAGSTWPKDEQLIQQAFNQFTNQTKLIIAPHEVDNEHILAIENLFPNNCMRLSNFNHDQSKRVLIVDGIGHLSMLYRYANIAYVGGGFGVGIHNILEPIVYGLPILIGPNHKKFNEAVELVQQHCVFVVNSSDEFNKQVNMLLDNTNISVQIKKDSSVYVAKKSGATKIVMDYMSLNYDSNFKAVK